MRKYAFVLLGTLLVSGLVFAEDAAQNTTPAPAEAVVEVETPSPAPEAVVAPTEVEAPTTAGVAEAPAADSVVSEAAPVAGDTASDLENLEFASGEVNTLDETAKTVTVKLYGESEDGKDDKVLTVKVDENTDITDGEKDRDLKSLAAGTEVDVEYDPVTNKATYIFVY